MAYSAANNERVYRTAVLTTDATVTTVQTIPVKLASVMKIKVEADGIRTGGSSGSAGDAAGYVLVATVKNVSGTAALVGAVTVLQASEDQAAWNCTISVTGGTAIVTVLGAANNNVTWSCKTTVIQNI